MRLDEAPIPHEPFDWTAVEKCAVEGGERTAMLLALGTDLDDANFYALSVPDAHELVHKLRRALDDPPPRRGP